MSETPQSTNHILMIEPYEFYTNPETLATNHYHHKNMDDHDVTFQKALVEFRGYRDMLVSHGVNVTTVKGIEGCPDHIFPNWASTNPDGSVIFYPMMNDNRRRERTPEMMAFFKKYYDVKFDLISYEEQGQYLEATGSLCIDHVNKVAYCALSPRSDAALAQEWTDRRGFELVTFDTLSHTGSPVYHTDLVMFIGTTCVGICSDALVEEDRARVLGHLRQYREVVEFSKDQLLTFCGNSLEVIGQGGVRYLAMAGGAHDSLSAAQVQTFGRHFDKIISSPIATIEKYGGGSARCLMMEMF